MKFQFANVHLSEILKCQPERQDLTNYMLSCYHRNILAGY